MICSITQHPAEEPVVSKHGHIFEKRVIEKYLETHEGKCPHTGEPLTAQDLISVKATKVAKPRPAHATSLPGLLQLMQNEWDSVMLETFTLKQQLDTARQELAQALYQHDASCRVIARLIKERDEARSALANARVNVNASNGTTTAQPKEGTDAMDTSGASSDILNAQTKIKAHAATLSAQRKKRTPSATTAKQEDIEAYKVVSNYEGQHTSTLPGILAVDLSADGTHIVTGGVDKIAVVLDRKTGKEVSKLSKHGKKILDVLFHPTEDMIFTASADNTAIGWKPETKGRKKGHSVAFTVQHNNEATGVSLHPTGDYIAVSSLDRTWSFYDIRAMKTVFQVSFPDSTKESGFTSIGWHPDGMIAGTPTEDGLVRLWDATSQSHVATFTGHKGAVTSISFSENGFYVATAGDDGTVKLWDLRKQTNLVTVNAEGPVHSVAFDFSGNYVLACSNDVRVLKTKTLDLIKNWSEHSGPVTDGVWGKDASFFATVSMDRSLKIWSK